METHRPASSSTTPRSAGPVSFFRLPTKDVPQDGAIAVIGLPYDAGTTNRAGTRHGPRALRDALRGLAGRRLIGADVVEVSPPLDPKGNTPLVGAK